MNQPARLKIEPPPAVDYDFCNTCGAVFDGEECLRQTLKNKRFLATLDPLTNEVVQECCEDCAQAVAGEIDPYE